jgi:protein SCO1/2
MNFNQKLKFRKGFWRLPLSLAALIALPFAVYLYVKSIAPQPRLSGIDITGRKNFGSSFVLLDYQDKPRTLLSYKGKVVILFFGYTNCPDICGSTLLELKELIGQLGVLSKDVQVIFVTVDPQRDTPDALRKYLSSFGAGFIGLRPANLEALERITKEFGIYYKHRPITTGGGYSVDHSTKGFAFDGKGEIRLYIKYDKNKESLINALRELLQ